MLKSLRGTVRKNAFSICRGGIFLKFFKTLDEQIQLLRDRNLIIEDEEFAKNYLLSSNYYSIINGYSKYFPRVDENYSGGTTFEEVAMLYLFDKELKQTFFKAVIDVEAHLKSIFAYRFAESFPNKAYAYLNVECYDRTKILSVISTISRLSQIINRQQKYQNTSINHYVNHHNDVPIWVLVDYLDFGELRNMLASSSSSLQNKVAKDLCGFVKQHFPDAGIFPPEIMTSFVENINEVRNVCAHNNRLLDFQCRRDCKYWADLHSRYEINANDQRRSVFSVFISMQCFFKSQRIFYIAQYCFEIDEKSFGKKFKDNYIVRYFICSWFSRKLASSDR